MAQPTLPPLDPIDHRAERAARIAAMLDRWETEGPPGDPDWNVEDIERLDLTQPPAPDEPAASTKR